MSKKGLYRTDVALLQSYSRNDGGGENIATYSEVVWVKGNIQPWRQGVVFDISQTGIRFNDYRVLYTREMPLLPPTVPLQPKTQKSLLHVYVEGKWYVVDGEQDYTTQAKGYKHYKLLLMKSPKPEGIPDPVPVSNLVSDFQRVVEELKQTSTILEEQANGY